MFSVDHFLHPPLRQKTAYRRITALRELTPSWSQPPQRVCYKTRLTSYLSACLSLRFHSFGMSEAGLLSRCAWKNCRVWTSDIQLWHQPAFQSPNEYALYALHRRKLTFPGAYILGRAPMFLESGSLCTVRICQHRCKNRAILIILCIRANVNIFCVNSFVFEQNC